MNSPLHQITQGISFLNTTGAMGGSITKGTPQPQNFMPLDLRSNTTLQQSVQQPIENVMTDVSMDTTPMFAPHEPWQGTQQFIGSTNPQQFVNNPGQFLPMVHPQVHMVSITGTHRSLNNSPISNPGSPGLDMIQEEITANNTGTLQQKAIQFCPENLYQTQPNQQQPFLNNFNPEGSRVSQIVLTPNANLLLNQLALNPGYMAPAANAQNHPQISLTDCLGSEITLVASSSEDSMDSLENHPKYSQFRSAQDLLPQFLISEPSDFEDRPSIMKGIGRKTSQENDAANKNNQNYSSMLSQKSSSDLEKPNVSDSLESNPDKIAHNPFSNFGATNPTELISPDCDRSNQLFLAQNPNSEEAKFTRRGSDKSLGFSDDSLSNDSNHSANASPNCEQNVTSLYSNIVSISSGFSENRGSFSEHRESFSERAGSEYRGSFSDRGSFSERGDFGRSSFSERSDLGTRSSFSEKGETPRSSFSAQGTGYSCVIGEGDEYQNFMSRDSSRTGLSALEKCEEEDSLCMQGDIDKLQKSTLDLRINDADQNKSNLILVKEEAPNTRGNEYYEVTLSDFCSKMDSSRILEVLKDVINTRVPPQNIFVFRNPMENSTNTGFSTPGLEAAKAAKSEGKDSPTTSNGCSSKMVETLNLNLEYSGGVQIELVVCEGKTKDNKGLKMRRISGDQFEYGKLCQQLISSLTV